MSNTTAFRERLGALRHDLRNPVGHVLGYGEMLDEDLEDAGAAELRSHLESIHGSADRMIRLIDEHLGASKESVAEIDFDATQGLLEHELRQVGGYVVFLRSGLAETDHGDLEPDLDRIAHAVATLREILAERLTPAHLGGSDETANAESTGEFTTEHGHATVLNVQ